MEDVIEYLGLRETGWILEFVVYALLAFSGLAVVVFRKGLAKAMLRGFVPLFAQGLMAFWATVKLDVLLPRLVETDPANLKMWTLVVGSIPVLNNFVPVVAVMSFCWILVRQDDRVRQWCGARIRSRRLCAFIGWSPTLFFAEFLLISHFVVVACFVWLMN